MMIRAQAVEAPKKTGGSEKIRIGINGTESTCWLLAHGGLMMMERRDRPTLHVWQLFVVL